MSGSSCKITIGLHLILLPGREHEAVSARPLQTVETQYFAVTRSQLPPESFVMPAFKAHHDKPLSHSLQLIKISQSNGGLASDKCILVCDSQESRKLLQDSVASEPYPGDGSSLSFSRCLQDFFIDCSFRNLVLLEYNLEKVVSLMACQASKSYYLDSQAAIEVSQSCRPLLPHAQLRALSLGPSKD